MSYNFSFQHESPLLEFYMLYKPKIRKTHCTLHVIQLHNFSFYYCPPSTFLMWPNSNHRQTVGPRVPKI